MTNTSHHQRVKRIAQCDSAAGQTSTCQEDELMMQGKKYSINSDVRQMERATVSAALTDTRKTMNLYFEVLP